MSLLPNRTVFVGLDRLSGGDKTNRANTPHESVSGGVQPSQATGPLRTQGNTTYMGWIT